MASDYVTRADILNALSATGTTYANDDIDDAITAASRAIDEACGRFFYTTAATAVYTPGDCPTPYGGYAAELALDIDDLSTLTSVKVDQDGDGTYETTWTNGTEFYLDPQNASLVSKPYERIVLRSQSGARFPGWANSVQVIGTFGWSTTPAEVTQYCKLFATQLMLRSRQAPFGVLMAGIEVAAATRISRYDPDFDRLLGHLVKPHRLIA